MLKDLQFAWRTLRARPLFAGIAVLSLALGIGANTAIFSIIESSLLRGLPYPHADRLVQLLTQQPCCGLTPVSPGEYFDYSRAAKTLSGLAAFISKSGTLTGYADVKSLTICAVTTNFFDVLGAKAQIGRLIDPQIDKPSANTRVAVLSDAAWHSIFDANSKILGQDIALNSNSFRVIGVLKPNQQYPSDSQVFISPRLDVPEYNEGPLPKNIDQQYGDHTMETVGRLRPGYTVRQSQAEMRTIAGTIAAQHPGERGLYARLLPIQEFVTGNVRLAIITLSIAVVLLLLIACANLAGLLLARATGRTREIAVRVALGANPGEIARLLLSESLLLALIGGALGIAFAAIGIRLLVHYSPYALPGVLVPDLNIVVLAFCVGVALLSALLSGILPAFHAARVDVNAGLKEGSKGTFSGGTHRLRSVLIGSEIAVSVMLLIGAGLLIHSFLKLIAVNPGFDPRNVISAHLLLPKASYPKDGQVVTYWQDLLTKLDNLPWVQSAGLLFNPPMAGLPGIGGYLQIEGRPYGTTHQGPRVELHVVSPQTLEALRIPLLQGRMFTERDSANASPVTIINKHFADRYFPHQNPIGKRFVWPIHSFISIVGVVGDVKYRSLDEQSELDFYTDYTQMPQNSMSLLLRSKPGFSLSISDLRSTVRSLDPNIPLTDVKPLGDYVGQSLASRKFLLGLLTTFSGLAILLAAIGLYAVLAYSVQQRKQEIGIRIALGATSSNVLWLILRECLTIAIVGTAVGLLGATWATSFLKSMLYGVTTTDLTAYTAAVALILTVAIAASLAPAIRATRIDPVTALRYE